MPTIPRVIAIDDRAAKNSENSMMRSLIFCRFNPATSLCKDNSLTLGYVVSGLPGLLAMQSSLVLKERGTLGCPSLIRMLQRLCLCFRFSFHQVVDRYTDPRAPAECCSHFAAFQTAGPN